MLETARSEAPPRRAVEDFWNRVVDETHARLTPAVVNGLLFDLLYAGNRAAVTEARRSFTELAFADLPAFWQRRVMRGLYVLLSRYIADEIELLSARGCLHTGHGASFDIRGPDGSRPAL